MEELDRGDLQETAGSGMVDRRGFLKWGTAGLAGVALAGLGDLSWLEDIAAASGTTVWKFGVMADTQWASATADGLNPGTCSVDIINKINARMIQHGVKFVIQVGDLVDSETDSPNGHPTTRTLPTRAAAAQALYDAGIGFYPLRGNHEGSKTAAQEFPGIFPQTTGTGANVFGATNFASPSIAGLNGLTYSFDYNNCRFVLLDQFIRSDGSQTDNNSAMLDQLPWIASTLSGRAADTHAFVFSHKNLIGQNHVDVLFGADPSKNPTQRDSFVTTLATNGVRYALGGHDHVHHRSIVSTADGTAAVEQIICASDSYKFYTPGNPANDVKYDTPHRETVVGQELWTIGYYVFTVAGPIVVVDFYSSSNGKDYSVNAAGNPDLSTIAAQNTVFYKRETFGYGLDGKQFNVPQGAAYTGVVDTWGGTTAKIIGGKNGDTNVDFDSRPLVKTVTTGWDVPPLSSVASNVFSLRGLNDTLALHSGSGLLPSADRPNHSDIYVLQLSYTRNRAKTSEIGRSHFGVGSKDVNGNWVNAVNLNTGGTKKFVLGPYNSKKHKLGTYGYNPKTKTSWAVLNYDGDFAVCRNI
jgi:hypothetical protein